VRCNPAGLLVAVASWFAFPSCEAIQSLYVMEYKCKYRFAGPST
jgi:hypothetical protein